MRYANTITGGIMAVLGYLTSYTELFGLLLLCMAVDFVTGLAKSYILQELSSRRCGIGVVKKTLILNTMVLVHYFALVAHTPEMEAMCLWFWTATEMLSIVENLVDCGVPIPDKLKNTLIQIRGKKNARRPIKKVRK